MSDDPRAAQPIAPPAPADPTAEYTAGGLLWSNRVAQSLGWAFDDVTRDFGDDIYSRMLYDPQVRACVNVLRTSVVSTGLQVLPAVLDPTADGAELAAEIAAFCASAIRDMETPIDDVIWDMLAAMPYGCRVAEEVYRREGSYLTLHALKVKPRTATTFVVDAYLNVLGVQARLPQSGYGTLGTLMATDLAQQPNVFPRSKFFVWTFRPESADPRGTSLLRGAYSYWWLKQQIPEEWLKFLATQAVPSVVGRTKNGAQILPGSSQSRAQAMLATLVALRNNSAIVLDKDDDLDPLPVPTNGADLFITSIDAADRQITTAILSATLSVMEGKHQSRAASEEHGSVVDQAIGQIKRSLCLAFRRDVLMPLVAANYGPKARALTPVARLGAEQSPDLAGLMDAIANLASANYLDVSQYPAIDAMLGLPPRRDDPDARTMEA